jgi:hypothetical protein
MRTHHPFFVRWPRLLSAAALTLSLACGSGSPTKPDGRTGYLALSIVCDGSGRILLRCSAATVCAGAYACPAPGPREVTQEAAWSSADTGIARLVAPGTFEAAGLGDTVIYARIPGFFSGLSEAQRTISVFEGTAPLPTNEIFGSVWEAGRTPATSTINGAVVEVLTGQVAGRTAISGVPPPLPPGFVGPFGGPGYYRILGVPPGTYGLRVVAAGYLSQERIVTVPANASPSANFEMARP